MKQIKEAEGTGTMEGISNHIPYDDLLPMLMNGISDFIFFVDVDGPRRFKYRYMNKSALMGSLAGGAVWKGKYIEEVMDENAAPPLIDAYEEAAQKKGPVTYEDQIMVNGKVFRSHSVLTPTLNEEGDVTHILAVTRNLTEVMEKEEALGSMNAVYKSLMTNTTDAVIILDKDGSVLDVNKAFTELYGFSKEDISGCSYPFVPEDLTDEACELVQQALEGRGTSGRTTIRKNRDGSLLDVSISVSRIQNEEGETIGVSSIIRNVTEEKNEERRRESSRSRYRSLFEHNPQAILTLTFRGTITNANPASLEMLEKEGHEVLHTSFMELISKEQEGAVRKEIHGSFFDTGGQFRTVVDVGGEEKILQISLVPIIIQDKKEGIYAILDDITEKEKAYEGMRQSQESFRLIANYSNDLISVFSPKGALIYASPSQHEFFGEDPMSWSRENLMQKVDLGDLRRLTDLFIKSCQTKEGFTITVKLTSFNGEPVWFECRATPVIDDDHEVSHIVVVARDISEQKSYEEKLERFAYYDYLTGLPNRLLFEENVWKAVEKGQRTGQAFAILYLDGDGFKGINDQYGHDMGDEFLREVGKRLRSCIRGGDSVARIGGDEFSVLVEELKDRRLIRDVSNRLLNELREPYYVRGMEIRTSFSIGVACFPEDGETHEGLFRAADTALYEGKKNGKNQVLFFEDQ
ncbi:PAS domain S-box protein [Halobacillus kuroshimensis]|uniref:PAS domain S-box protein n=1 Tax=Halobacillus kuroshimensis TaxID=302481 RepID=A0ABS3DVJ2_9BACI|nr:PAS domain S-box protein [Halobacillus kuroshimensis]